MAAIQSGAIRLSADGRVRVFPTGIRAREPTNYAGSGSFVANARDRQQRGSAAYSGVATIIGKLGARQKTTGVVSATATLLSSVVAARPGKATLSGATSLLGNKPGLGVSVSGRLAGNASQLATIISARRATGTISGTASLGAVVAARRPTRAVLSGTGTSVAALVVQARPQGPISGAASLAGIVAARRPATALLSASGSIGGVIFAQRRSRATLSGVANVLVTGAVQRPARGIFSGTASIAATAVAGRTAATSLSGNAILYAQATGFHPTPANQGYAAFAAMASIQTFPTGIIAHQPSRFAGTGAMTVDAVVPGQALPMPTRNWVRLH